MVGTAGFRLSRVAAAFSKSGIQTAAAATTPATAASERATLVEPCLDCCAFFSGNRKRRRQTGSLQPIDLRIDDTGPIWKFSIDPGSYTDLQNPAAFSQAHTEFQYQPHIVDTDTIVDAFFLGLLGNVVGRFRLFRALCLVLALFGSFRLFLGLFVFSFTIVWLFWLFPPSQTSIFCRELLQSLANHRIFLNPFLG